MISLLQNHVLDLVEAVHASGQAHGVHVVEAEVQQGLGSSSDTVSLAGDIMLYRCLIWLINSFKSLGLRL